MDLTDIFSGALTPAKWKALGDYLSQPTISGGPGMRIRRVGNQTIISTRRERGGAGGGGESSPCSFGSIVSIDDATAYTKGIRGGLIVCGDQNFNVNYQGLDTDPATNGVWLVQITLSGIECATDDDGEIFLPGVITSTSTPAWALVAWTAPTDYTPNTNPTGPATPTGTVVIPVGKLTITDGVPSLESTGCGSVTIGQCAGILSVTRG